jgi:phage replication O-like protein O
LGASPQLEDGFFRVANELGEAFARTRLAGQECQIVWAVLRKTFGYGKKSDRISYGQISKMTLIPRTRVILLVKRLVHKNVLGHSPNIGTRTPATLWINKHYNEWSILDSPNMGTTLVPIQGLPPSPILCESEILLDSLNGTATSDNSRDLGRVLPSPNMGTHKRKLHKENKTKENGAAVALPEWLDFSLWEKFKKHCRALKSEMTEEREELLFKELDRLRKSGCDVKAVIEQSILRGWKALFPLDKRGTAEEPVTDWEKEMWALGGWEDEQPQGS